MKSVTVHNMRTPFFVEADRDRAPRAVIFNKFPMGLFIPCTFDEDGKPNVEEVCQQLREMVASNGE